MNIETLSGSAPRGTLARPPHPWYWSLALAAVLVLAALIGGCESTSGGADVAAARQRSESLAAAGDHAGAARTLEAVIASSSGDLREALLLDAAREWVYAGNTARAVALARQRSGALNDVTDPATRLIGASQALTQRQPSIALQWLEGITRPYPEALTSLILEQTSRAHFANGNPVAAVAALTERELWLSSDAQVLDNHRLLWRSLSDSTAPLPAAGASTDPTVEGWLALARLAQRLQSSPGRVRGDLIEWHSRFPGHPANAQIVPSLLAQYRSSTTLPEHVALLLPLSGGLARPAQAIRDGFVSAVLGAGEDARAIRISVYDTAASGAVEAYGLALAEGAEFVVGPLRKEQVLAVAQLDRRVPTLTLNDPGELTMPPGSDLYRYALAPEDEARQAARRATRDGSQNLIALIPNSNWGERLLASVRDALALPVAPVATPGTGEDSSLTTATDQPTQRTTAPDSPVLVDYGYYANSAVDFSAPIRRVLRLDSSERRYDELKRILGERVEFEPRRREDVDALFVAASAAKARLIRPQLRFHYAADLPVYMTSAALNPEPGENAELDGVFFADIPWLATDQHAGDPRWEALERYSAEGVRRARLYAFGVDAFGLIPAMWSGIVGNEVLLEGLTGNLRAEPDGRISRDLAILQLRDDELVQVWAPGDQSSVPAARIGAR